MRNHPFSPRPDVNSANFYFKAEIDPLPFKLNMGTTIEMTCEQQSQFINIIYDNSEVFSLHDEDLGFYNKIKHTIPTTSDRPVYLAHCSIPPQLLGEACKCFGYLVEAGNYKTISKPLCFPDSDCVKKVRGNLSVHRLPETQFHYGKRCFSTTKN